MAPQVSKQSKRKKNEEEEVPDTPNKKAKVPVHNYLPTNKDFPTKLDFPPKAENTWRISAWNVCSVKACDKKGLKTYLEAENPDIIIMSETRTRGEEPDILHLKHQFKYRYWGSDPTKGYAGVAILSKHKPLNVVYGLPTAPTPSDHAGRTITLEFSSFYLVGTYTPNAGDKLKFMEKKKEWNDLFEKYLRELDAKKPVVWGGDINCAPTELDLRNASQNWNKTAGYTQEECDALHRLLNPPDDSGHKKLIDVWRARNPELEGHYTYFSYRFGSRQKGIGWRIDSFLVSERVAENVKLAEIRHDCYGASDHLPIIIDISIPETDTQVPPSPPAS